jgi:hypothetical protein
MNIPHYINENKSDIRGIKSGWYAAAEDGSLSARGVPHRSSSAGWLGIVSKRLRTAI